MHSNIILDTDSYKTSHYRQYPPGAEYVYSYVESRGGAWDRTLFFGLQMFLKDYLCHPVTMADIDEAEPILLAHGMPFNRAGWEHIVRAHGGFLPVEIKAVDEGSILPTSNVLCTIVNTDPECYWLTSYLETALLRAIWYPTTVATNSHMCKGVIRRWLDKTCDDPEAEILFKLHDFGARGVSSRESAAIGGLAHLVNFRGSDTLSAILAARRFYGEEIAGFSIPAAEHSTITSWGRDGEADAYENMLRQFAQQGKLVAVVSDSYDIFNAVDALWGGERLRSQVQESGATIVIRPDSGNPPDIVLKCVDLLANRFGHSVNHKGYRVLAPCIRVIQGDGINIRSIETILRTLEAAGWSAENVAFGMGGGLLQQLDRDTLKFAMKCSAIRVGGAWRDVWKDPVTDAGKASKRGRFALITEDGVWATVPRESNDWRDMLHIVYRDGRLVREHSLRDIRERASRPMIGE
jgi:nicotinamide phosphoribosyltransferase